jgi:hypothetical protein
VQLHVPDSIDAAARHMRQRRRLITPHGTAAVVYVCVAHTGQWALMHTHIREVARAVASSNAPAARASTASTSIASVAAAVAARAAAPHASTAIPRATGSKRGREDAEAPDVHMLPGPRARLRHSCARAAVLLPPTSQPASRAAAAPVRSFAGVLAVDVLFPTWPHPLQCPQLAFQQRGNGTPVFRPSAHAPALQLLTCSSVVFAPAAHPLDTAWSTRLVRLDNMVKALVSANAYISTLGGGHFLCRHIKDAMRLARAQMCVARALGDPQLEARCHVHLIYAWIQTGRFRTAMRRLKVLDQYAARTGDDGLAAMVVAGTRYCRKTAELVLSGTLDALPPSQEDALFDELYRQRIVALQ